MHSRTVRSSFAFSLEVSDTWLTFASILLASPPLPVISFVVLQLCQVSYASCRVHGYPYREPRFACLFSSVVRRTQSPDKYQNKINIVILVVNVPHKLTKGHSCAVPFKLNRTHLHTKKFNSLIQQIKLASLT